MTWNGHEKWDRCRRRQSEPGSDHGGLVVVDDDLAHEDDVDVDISKSWTQ